MVMKSKDSKISKIVRMLMIDVYKRQADNERFCYFQFTFVTQNSIQNDQFPANTIRFLLADS